MNITDKLPWILGIIGIIFVALSFLLIEKYIPESTPECPGSAHYVSPDIPPNHLPLIFSLLATLSGLVGIVRYRSKERLVLYLMVVILGIYVFIWLYTGGAAMQGYNEYNCVFSD